MRSRRLWSPFFFPQRKPGRLLFFSHETTWSGAPLQLYYLAEWLQRRGWQVAVVVPKPTSLQSGPITAKLAALGMEVFPLLDFSLPPDLDQFRSLCAQFDLVVANTLVMWAAVRAAQEADVPVIWYIHESAVLWQLLELNPEIRATLATADLTVFPTSTTAQLYAPLTRGPREVVPYGIPPVGVNAPAERDTGCIRFLLLGSYEPRKGQDLFLDAIAQLPAASRDTALFQMAGRKLDQVFYQAVAQRAQDAKVRLGDELEHDEALAATAATDVLVCASRDETMPLAILEAMSLGKAIVTTNVGGMTEWLRDGVNALIVSADDSAALAGALQRCLEEPDLVRSLGRKARQTFSAEFSLDRLGRRFSRLIQRLMQEKKS